MKPAATRGYASRAAQPLDELQRQLKAVELSMGTLQRKHAAKQLMMQQADTQQRDYLLEQRRGDLVEIESQIGRVRSELRLHQQQQLLESGESPMPQQRRTTVAGGGRDGGQSRSRAVSSFCARDRGAAEVPGAASRAPRLQAPGWP